MSQKTSKNVDLDVESKEETMSSQSLTTSSSEEDDENDIANIQIDLKNTSLDVDKKTDVTA